jgi:hypothetical protein
MHNAYERAAYFQVHRNLLLLQLTPQIILQLIVE